MSDWDYGEVFTHQVRVAADAIDVMGHVNNVQYLRWMEDTAWAHSASLGLGWEVYTELGCGVVAIRHEIDYLRPAFEGDELEVGTWCTGNDGRLRLLRSYQVRRPADGQTCARGRTLWVCVDLKTQRPCRMPALFKSRYQPVPGSPPFP